MTARAAGRARPAAGRLGAPVRDGVLALGAAVQVVSGRGSQRGGDNEGVVTEVIYLVQMRGRRVVCLAAELRVTAA